MVRTWADKQQLVQATATRRNGKDCHRQAPLPGAWNMSKNAGKWKAGAAVAIRWVCAVAPFGLHIRVL